MTTSKFDRVMGEKFKTEHTQAPEEASMDIRTVGHTTATNCLQDAFYTYIENILTEMTLKSTLKNLFKKSPERRT